MERSISASLSLFEKPIGSQIRNPNLEILNNIECSKFQITNRYGRKPMLGLSLSHGHIWISNLSRLGGMNFGPAPLRGVSVLDIRTSYSKSFSDRLLARLGHRRESGEFLHGCTRVNGFGSHCEALLEIRRFLPCHDGGGRVQEDDISLGAILAR